MGEPKIESDAIKNEAEGMSVDKKISIKSLPHGKGIKSRQKADYTKHFIKQPNYQEFSRRFQSRKKLGGGVYWVMDTLCGCDWNYLPSELQFYLQSHPKLTLVITYSLTFSILLVAVAIGYMYYDLMRETLRTFSWRALTIIFLMPGSPTNKKILGLNELNNLPQLPNCSIYEAHHYYKFALQPPYVAFICLATIILAQVTCLLFLIWRSFKPYTFQIAVLSLKCQGSFLAIALLVICLHFFQVVSKLKQEMRDEMGKFTSAGISAWWQMTQEKSKCCGLDRPTDWKKVSPDFWTLLGQRYPLSCCDAKVSLSKCTELPTEEEIFTHGCYEKVRNNLDLHGALLIVAVAWTIIVSVGLIYLFEGVEILTRRKWKRPNSSYDSKVMSVETFGSVEIVSLDGTKYYSMLEIHNEDFNPFTDGIYDFKYEYEYDIEFQRGETIMGKAVVETSNMSDRNLKLELEFDETEGTVTMVY